MQGTGIEGCLVRVEMIPTILFSYFFQPPPSLRHPTPIHPSTSIPDAPGAIPKVFPGFQGIQAFSLGMQACWNVQLGSVASRGPITSLPTPMPAHQLLLSIFSSHSPCISPSSTLTPPPAPDPQPPGAWVGGETKTGFITRIEKQPETRAEGNG